MSEATPSFFERLSLALNFFYRTLTEPDLARAFAWLKFTEFPPGASFAIDEGKPKAAVLKETDAQGALQILALLQREGRLVDFIQEDMGAYSDADIGAAARVVHEGCRKALREHLKLEIIREEEEGTRITVEKGFDATALRLSGNLVGEPPFTGTLTHRGWRATELTLPKVAEGHDLHVLAPAEVEL